MKHMTEVRLKNHIRDRSTNLQIDLLLILPVHPRSSSTMVLLNFLRVCSAHWDPALYPMVAADRGFLMAIQGVVLEGVVLEVLGVVFEVLEEVLLVSEAPVPVFL